MLTAQLSRISKLSKLVFAFCLATLVSCHMAADRRGGPVDAVAINRTLEQTPIVKSPNNNRSYAAIMLPNGLQVVLVSDPSLQNAAASLAVGVGSAQDPASQLGLAHYLEHMLFLGTQKYPTPNALMNFVKANGGISNAFTGFDRTNYFFAVNAGQFEQALEQFSDYFKNPTFDPAYSEKERNAVHSEWSLKKGQDERILLAIQSATINPQHPAARFSVGNLSTLSDKADAKLQDELVAFYRRYYSANIMKLTLTGNQSLQQLKLLAHKHFAAIPNHNISLPTISVRAITAGQMGKLIRYKPQRDTKAIFIDYPLVANKQDWRFKAEDYIKQLLASEEPGSLGAQLREQGLAKAVSASMQSDVFGADGFLRIVVDLTEQGLNQRDKVVGAVFAYINLIKNSKPDERYHTQSRAVAEHYFATAPTAPFLQQTIALSMGQFDFPVANLLNNYAVFDAFNARKITALTDQLQHKNVRVWFVDQSQQVTTPLEFYDGLFASRDISAEEFSRWQQAALAWQFKLPPLNELFVVQPMPLVPTTYKKPQKIVDKPGIEAHLAHSIYFNEDKGIVTLQLNIPAEGQNFDKQILAKLLNYIYKQRTLSLTDRAAAAALSVNTWLDGSFSQVITVAGSTYQHEYLLAAMVQEFATLKIDQALFAQAVDSFVQNLEAKSKAPLHTQALEHMRRLTRPQQKLDEDYIKRVKTLNLADLHNYHLWVKQNLLLRLLAFGNYSNPSIERLAAKLQGTLPSSRSPATRFAPQAVAPGKGAVLEFLHHSAQTDDALLQVWFTDKKSPRAQAGLDVLATFVDSTFYNQLRTQEQLGYVVQSGALEIAMVPGFMFLVQSPNTDVAALKNRTDRFRLEFAKTLAALDEAAIQSAATTLAANIQQKPADFYQESHWYLEEFLGAEYGFNRREQYLAALQQVNKAQLLELYQSIILNERAGRIVVQMRGTNQQGKPSLKLP